MRLTGMDIEGFRSIQDTLKLNFDPKVTTIIGANDHGKSNLLVGLEHLRPDNPFTEGDICRADDRFADTSKFPRITYRLAWEPGDWDRIKSFLAGEDQDGVEEDDEALSEDDPPEEEPEGFEGTDLTDEAWLGNNRMEDPVLISRNGVGSELEILVPTDSKSGKYREAILRLVPEVILVKAFPEIKSSVDLAELATDEFEVMRGLVKLARLWEHRDLVFTSHDTKPQARNILNKAKERLNETLRNAWAQGEDYNYSLSFSTGRLHFDIEDQTGHYDVPAVRGLGLRTFLEFHLTLFSRTDTLNPRGYIFAFDEPALHLHPQGQKDWLRIIEQLSESNQIVYVTHSLFLVNRNYPHRTVLVTKDRTGTHLMGKPFQKNWHPVHRALGSWLADTLYAAEKVLLVEGASDRIYLSALLAILAADEQNPLDLNQFSIKDLYEDANIIPYLQVLHEEGRTLVLLVDADKAGVAKAKTATDWATARQKAEKHEVKIPTVMIPGTKPLTLEDILPRERYIAALRKYLADLIEGKIVTPPDGFNLDDLLKTLPPTTTEKSWAMHLQDGLKQTAFGSSSKVGVARTFVQQMEEENVQDLSGEEWNSVRVLADNLAKALELRPKSELTKSDVTGK